MYNMNNVTLKINNFHGSQRAFSDYYGLGYVGNKLCTVSIGTPTPDQHYIEQFSQISA